MNLFLQLVSGISIYFVANCASAQSSQACPASIKGGDINNPTELVDSSVRRDSAYVSALLMVTVAALRTPQKRCDAGSSEWCKIAEFHAKAKAGLECYAGIATQNVTNSAQTGTPNTAGQMNSGSATNMGSLNSRPSYGVGTQGSINQSAAATRFQSQEANSCVEIVPKGFKCDGRNERFLTNICRNKITVRWRLGNDSWGQQSLEPAACYPVSYYKDDRSVQYQACSWDSNSGYGPFMNPCRYP